MGSCLRERLDTLPLYERVTSVAVSLLEKSVKPCSEQTLLYKINQYDYCVCDISSLRDILQKLCEIHFIEKIGNAYLLKGTSKRSYADAAKLNVKRLDSTDTDAKSESSYEKNWPLPTPADLEMERRENARSIRSRSTTLSRSSSCSNIDSTESRVEGLPPEACISDVSEPVTAEVGPGYGCDDLDSSFNASQSLKSVEDSSCPDDSDCLERIMNVIRQGIRRAKEIAEKSGLPVDAVQRYLHILLDKKIVSRTKKKHLWKIEKEVSADDLKKIEMRPANLADVQKKEDGLTLCTNEKQTKNSSAASSHARSRRVTRTGQNITIYHLTQIGNNNKIVINETTDTDED